jgi:16S rRNA (cytosine967-C5)-methyltransferase
MNTTAATARQCAVELLSEVLDSRRPLDEAMARHSAFAALADRDRNFVRLLIMTALRRLGQIDALIAQMLEKPLQGKSRHVMHSLRLGVVQLIWLETPPHAAVHSTVEAIGALGYDNMKGLVNAVLKRVSREGAAIIKKQDEARLNIPAWLYQSWTGAYGEATARAIVIAAMQEPPLDISVKEDAGLWAEKLGGALLPTGSVRMSEAGRVDGLTGYAEGAWWVQDTAASLPVGLLGDVRGKLVFDLCAAPGGKTAQLAAAGAHVVAVDKSKRRLEILSANMQRLGLQVEMVESDILKWKPPRTPDIVLLDAPCSATGTLRRHPEVVWSRTQEDVLELAALQKKLLNRAAGWLKKDGKLLYCVCSLQPEEGEAQAEHFISTHPEFAPVPAAPKRDLQPPIYTSENGAIRTHPALMAGAGGMDGFYANCWVRLNNP